MFPFLGQIARGAMVPRRSPQLLNPSRAYGARKVRQAKKHINYTLTPKPVRHQNESQQVQDPEMRQLIKLIQHTVRHDGADAGEDLVHKLEQGGYRLPAVVYNQFIKLYGDQCRIHDVERWRIKLQQLAAVAPPHPKPANNTSSGPTAPTGPDTYTYTLLINAYNRAGFGAKAIDVWQDFCQTRLPMTWPLISILLDTLGYHKQTDLLVNFWQSIQPEWRTKLDENNHNSYLEALLRNRHFEQAIHHFSTDMWPPPPASCPTSPAMDDQRLPEWYRNTTALSNHTQYRGPSRKTLLTMIRPLKRGGHLQALRQLIRHVQRYYPQTAPLVADIIKQSD
ncbi:hypothetical protein H4R35_001989 [Dimargaris xerosporica]|nr:hypothetical protein H4R35_001989 [Dimargaris xerosporica]